MISKLRFRFWRAEIMLRPCRMSIKISCVQIFVGVRVTHAIEKYTFCLFPIYKPFLPINLWPDIHLIIHSAIHPYPSNLEFHYVSPHFVCILWNSRGWVEFRLGPFLWRIKYMNWQSGKCSLVTFFLFATFNEFWCKTATSTYLVGRRYKADFSYVLWPTCVAVLML